MSAVRSTSRGVKPTLPPKPKSLCKPRPPPKPANLHKLISLRAASAGNVKLNGNNDKSSIVNYDCKSYIHERIITVNEIHIPSLSLHSSDSSSSIESSGNIENNNNGIYHKALHRTSNSEAYVPSSAMNEDNSAIWRNGCDGSRSPVSSTESSVCSDALQDSALEDADTLEKLSDLECSERSGSSSPYQKNDPCLNPLDSFDSSHTHIDCDTNGLTSTNLVPSDQIEISVDKKRKIYNIAKEMMTSEEVFCNILKLLNVELRQSVTDQGCIISNCSKNNSRNGLPEDELNKILNYLPQLQNFSEGFLADLKQRLTDWDQHNKIADIIVTKGPFLKMYSSYIRDFEHQCSLLDDARSRYPSFGRSVQNFEASDVCCKLGIKQHMLKPVQRIPQYRLLFQSYLDLLSPSSPDIDDAKKALAILEQVATHANDTIKIEDKVSELLTLQRRLYRSQDGTQPELIKPGRELLKQGELKKLSRRGSQPRYFVLLSDGLLYTSYSSSGTGMLRLNTELPLEGMKVTKPIADDFSAELTIRATQRSFTLQARSEGERDEWLAAVQSAIDANIERRSTFLAASTAAYVKPNIDELGKQAPVWIPDYRVTMCQLCTAEFSLTFRRHHCRACGKVVCDQCSNNRAPLEYKKNHPERVCDQCYDSLFIALQTRIEQIGTNGNCSDQQQHEKHHTKKQLTTPDLKRIKQTFKKGIRDSMRGKSHKKPERLLEVSGNDIGSQMRGYLRRSGRRGWYVLKERVLYQYAAPEDVCALDSTPVLGYKLETKGLDGEGAESTFTLSHPNQDDMSFVADTTDLALKWVAVMEDATVL